MNTVFDDTQVAAYVLYLQKTAGAIKMPMNDQRRASILTKVAGFAMKHTSKPRFGGANSGKSAGIGPIGGGDNQKTRLLNMRQARGNLGKKKQLAFGPKVKGPSRGLAASAPPVIKPGKSMGIGPIKTRGATFAKAPGVGGMARPKPARVANAGGGNHSKFLSSLKL